MVATRSIGPRGARRDRTGPALRRRRAARARRPRGVRRRGARPRRGRACCSARPAPRRAPAGLGDALLRRADPRRRRHATSSSRRSCPASRPASVVAHAGAPRGRPPASRERPTTTYADGRVTGRKIGVTLRRPARRACSSPRSTATDAVVALVDPQRPRRHPAASRGSSAGSTRRTPSSSTAPRPSCCPATTPRTAAAPSAPSPGSAVTAAGVVAGARDLTADYVKGRTQFGRALAEFQAVAMQIADVYIASRTLDLAADNAAWRVADGLDARRRPRRGGVLDLRRGARRAAHLPPPARRHGRRRDLPAAPLLLVGHRHRARARRAARPSAVPVEDPTAKNLELTDDAARAQGRAARPTSPASADHDEHREMGARPARRGLPADRSGRWAPTAGWASAGRRSTAATGSARSSRRSSPTRPSAPTCTCRR